jgi:hypothetical protein
MGDCVVPEDCVGVSVGRTEQYGLNSGLDG